MLSSKMSSVSHSNPTGWRILGFGKHPEIAAAIQEKLRSLGFRATNFVLTNDEAGDARLAAELKQAEYDGVAIGGYINGQDAMNFPATEETTVWFNRILNIVHANAPGSKIILVRGPEDVVPAIERVLGKNPPPGVDADRRPARPSAGAKGGTPLKANVRTRYEEKQ